MLPYLVAIDFTAHPVAFRRSGPSLACEFSIPDLPRENGSDKRVAARMATGLL
jgi:hypothetical protein